VVGSCEYGDEPSGSGAIELEERDHYKRKMKEYSVIDV
jgi:hypothetical protein